jgi:hypothetical protein
MDNKEKKELSAEELEKVTGAGEIHQMTESGKEVAKRVKMIRAMMDVARQDREGSN